MCNYALACLDVYRFMAPKADSSLVPPNVIANVGKNITLFVWRSPKLSLGDSNMMPDATYMFFVLNGHNLVIQGPPSPYDLIEWEAPYEVMTQYKNDVDSHFNELYHQIASKIIQPCSFYQ